MRCLNIFVLLALWALPALGQDRIAVLREEAARRHLSDQRGWRALLFMRDRVLGPPTSMVDAPDFFLAKDQPWSPEAELAATVAALLRAPEPAAQMDDHPVCRFPARRAWLSANLPGFAEMVPPLSCSNLESWQAQLRAESVSYVFSSYFAGNPSSLFGHSFLHFRKRPRPGKVESVMLDEAVNFSAYPTTSNPVLYAIYGLMGGFPGRFSTTPFYMKVQEYNNAESRDLWDYELAFDAADINRLELVLWEMGPHWINYWYFDENCSLILLAALEAAKPSLSLAPLHPWVIPSDSLRVLQNSPGLVTAIHYRPSAMSRFMASYEALAPAERGVAAGIVAANDTEEALFALRLLAPKDQARISDAVTEFIDYDEKLAGSKESTEYAALRQMLLARRASLQEPRLSAEAKLPFDERPHLPGGTTRIGGGGGYSPQGGALLQAEWRPAMHDLLDPALGYSPGLAITFFDTVLRYAEQAKKPYFERWDLLTIRSVPHNEPILSPFSWGLDLGVQNLGYCAEFRLNCFDKHLGGGVGPALALGSATFYGIFGGQLGSSGETGLKAYLGPKASTGILFTPSARQQFGIELTAARYFGIAGTARDELSTQVAGSFMLDDADEVRLSLLRRSDGTGAPGGEQISEAMVSVYHFY